MPFTRRTRPHFSRVAHAESLAALLLSLCPWALRLVWPSDVAVKRSERRRLNDSLAQSLGETVLGAILAAGVWAVLIASRVSQAGAGSWASAWAAVVALSLPAVLLLVIIARATDRAFCQLIAEPGARCRWITILAACSCVSSVLLSKFAAVLQAGTHHRGLGGATFGVIGLALVAGCVLVIARLASLLRGWIEHTAVAWSVAITSSLAVLFLLRPAVVLPGPGLEPSAAALIAYDSTSLAIACLFASQLRMPHPYSRLAAPASSGVFVLLVAIGLTMAPRMAAAAVARMASEAPILRPLMGVIGHEKSAAAEALPAASAPLLAPSASESARRARSGPPLADSSLAGPRSKPDVILVSIDALRADHVGSYGYKRAVTPTLDAFAADSVLFERAYAAGPETRTAIAPLVTGKYLEQCARDDRPWPTLLEDNETLAERLHKAGYATGAVSSFQWLSTERGFSQGFDLFDESPYRKVHAERWATGAHAVAQGSVMTSSPARASRCSSGCTCSTHIRSMSNMRIMISAAASWIDTTARSRTTTRSWRIFLST